MSDTESLLGTATKYRPRHAVWKVVGKAPYGLSVDHLAVVAEYRAAQGHRRDARRGALIKKKTEGQSHMERIYKKIEIVGSSETSFGEAAQNAVAKACQMLRHVDWFEVIGASKVLTEPDEGTGLPVHRALYISPYSVLIFSQ